jgi:hypothetical protein
MWFFGFRKSSGKHAAPKGHGHVPAPRPSTEEAAHRPAHAATMPRVTGPHAEQEAADSEEAAAERRAA